MANWVLRGDGLTLHPLTVSDVSERYVSWLNDAEVTAGTELRFTSHSIKDVCDYVARANASPTDEMWKIMLEGEGHVGNIRLSSINVIHRRARVALLIGEKSVWGRGIGTAAIVTLSRHAFEDMKLHKLSAGIYANNLGSRRAFEKAGFSLEATLKDEAFADNQFVDIWLMSRIS